jgi:ribosomal protein S18 acetylase RimI-like enzyme
VTTTAAELPVRARFGRWPHDDDVVHLVLLDHHMVPSVHDVRRWIAQGRSAGARAIRTGALFPPSTPAFLDAGFDVIDTLRLLELDLTPDRAAGRLRPGSTPERLRRRQLGEAAEVDRRSFGAPWGNDASALGDIVDATPRTRARCVRVDGRMVAFLISGRAGRTGYVQRLAVDPSERRRGLASLLLADAVGWMHRHHVSRVLVNTAVDNDPATSLYLAVGFVERPERLSILERRLDPARSER